MLYRNVKRGLDPELATIMHGELGESAPDEHVYGEESWDGETWHRFTGWLPLLRIAMAIEKPGPLKVLFSMSDHPSMAGDWSAIRDSSRKTIAAMEAVAKRYIPDSQFYAQLGIAP